MDLHLRWPCPLAMVNRTVSLALNLSLVVCFAFAGREKRSLPASSHLGNQVGALWERIPFKKKEQFS